MRLTLPPPRPVALPAAPPRAWIPTHIYISQQMAGRIYNNAITRMRFSSVLGTQGLGPWQIQSLLIYPARLQIKRHPPLPQGGLPAGPGQQGPRPPPEQGLAALRSRHPVTGDRTEGSSQGVPPHPPWRFWAWARLPGGPFLSPALCWTWMSSGALTPQASTRHRARPTGDLPSFCISNLP